MIGLKCPKCQTVMKVDEAQAGAMAACPGCGVKLRIPNLKSPGGSKPVPSAPSSPGADAAGLARRPPTGRQTAIQARSSTPPSDPSVRAAGPGGAPPEPLEEELEYTVEDIEEPQVPPPPKRRRPVEIEDEDENEDEDEIDEEEDDLDEEDEEEEEEEEEIPRERKKKKKKGEAGSVLGPVVVGILVVLVIGACTGIGFWVSGFKKAAADPTKALAMIEKHHGQIIRDQNDPEQPVIEVSLQGSDADNGDLALLRAFPKLQKLNMASCTKISNPGLAWLEDLKELRVLRLNFCSHVHDGGMEYIAKLTNLEELYLDQTITTDRGLHELRGLKKLKKIGLSGTLADGRGLQAAIPGLEILK
jgi:hypothetical protein